MAVHKFKKSVFQGKKYCTECGIIAGRGEKRTDMECAPNRYRYGRSYSEIK
jgi:hypothetical protein